MSGETKHRGINWVYSVFPVSVASGPLGTMVQLYLIHLDGLTLGTIYGGLAAAFFNGVSIPAALFWGLAIDRFHRRRPLIVLSYALMSAVLISFYFDSSTAGTIASYSVFSFVSVASATPLNLLIMETAKKDRWAVAFARLSMVSSVGNVGGLLISTFWSQFLPGDLVLLFVPMGLFALASTVLALVTVKEPPFVLERETVALRKPSFFSRLRAIPVFFLTIPRASDFQRAFRGLRSSLTSYVPLFYISTILFYLSSGLFNTAFVPGMHSFALTDQEVFAVILAGMVVQTIAFQGAGPFIEQRSLGTSTIQGLLLRGLSYAAIGFLALFLGNRLFLGPVLVFYPLAAGVAFAVYYTASNTMMFNTVQKKTAGSALGVYSAVVGIASMAGALASGFISVYLGFYTTFLLSGSLLLIAVAVVARMPSSTQGAGGIHQ